MKLFTYSTGAISRFRKLPMLLLALLAFMAFAGNAGAAATPVPLGTAGSFAVLSGLGVTDVPNSAIVGDVGVSPGPGTSITGLTCGEVTGTIYAVDSLGLPCFINNSGLLGQAKNDLTTAYGDAAGEPVDATLAGSDNQLGLAGTLVAGVYTFGSASTANLVGNLTLSGDASSVWVFQASSDLVVAGTASVTFIGGASPCNVYWQVASAATINGGANFAGTILAAASVTMGTGATLLGRALAGTGNVTLDHNTINSLQCAASTAPAAPPAPQPPPREIYCSPAGVAYDLVAGQNLLPPYNLLGLVPAYVDPVTGSKSCTFPAAIVPVVPTPVVPTPVTPTPVTPTPTSPTPAQKAAAAAKKKAAAAKVAARKRAAAHAVLARRAKTIAANKAKAKPGAPPKTATGGFTG